MLYHSVVCRLELDRQVHDKLMRKEAEKQHELSYGKGHIAEAEQARQAEMQRKLALLNKNKAYKMQLQDQMKCVQCLALADP